jgi:hypothetical protein
MQILKDLLEATIRYQDIIDERGTKDDYVADAYEDMISLSDLAKEKHPELMAPYEFGFKKDIQEEFDNLQKFINDFNKNE